MANLVVVLSGSVSSGKTTLVDSLNRTFGFYVLKSRELIRQLVPDIPNERAALQAAGDKLDAATGGSWLARELAYFAKELPDDAPIVVDAVRIKEQIDHIRSGFGQRVKHIHIEASPSDLSDRYGHRVPNVAELPSYEDVQKNVTESQVPELAQAADVVVNTSRCTPEDVLVRVACHLGLYGRGYDRVVDVIVGGQYGSEGKGQIAAYLAREYDLLIRVGGPNAGHKVYELPKPYTFHCLPSGSRCSQADVVLGAGAVVDVQRLLKEINDCEITPERLTIDPQVLVITDEDRV